MKIKLLFMDVDGTLTDGKIYIGSTGELVKSFNIKDGYGIAHILPEHGVVPVIITGRASPILTRRCEELGITELYQNKMKKVPVLESVCKKYGVDFSQTAYIGDDLPDLPCIELCGFTGCPADSVEEIKAACDYVCKKEAGYGAVREFIEQIINCDK